MPEHRRNRKNFIHIGEVIDNVLHQYRPINDQALMQVWQVWEEAVGSTIAQNAKPAVFKGDLLLVNVSSSTWLHQIRFMEQEMIAKINEAIGTRRLRSIKFKIGAV